MKYFVKIVLSSSIAPLGVTKVMQGSIFWCLQLLSLKLEYLKEKVKTNSKGSTVKLDKKIDYLNNDISKCYDL